MYLEHLEESAAAFAQQKWRKTERFGRHSATSENTERHTTRGGVLNASMVLDDRHAAVGVPVRIISLGAPVLPSMTVRRSLTWGSLGANVSLRAY